MIVAVEVKEQCRKCFHFQVCASVLKNDLYIREVMLGEKEPKCKAFVEAVRCKDCKHCEPAIQSYNEKTMECQNGNGIWRKVKPDDFCSYGERRNDG